MFSFTGHHAFLHDDDNGGSGGNYVAASQQQYLSSPLQVDDSHDLFHAIRNLPFSANAPPPVRPAAETLEEEPPCKDAGGRRRGARKDRHSKIVTAKGPRDRRMRLSLEVARPFFDLHDALQFDNPSKTVGWLLNMSKHAIRSLPPSCSAGSKHTTSSECEVDSAAMGVHTTFNDDDDDEEEEEEEDDETIIVEARHVPPPQARDDDGTAKQPWSSRSKLAKELRNKARERARERTREKRKKKILENLEPPPCFFQSCSLHEANTSESGADAPPPSQQDMAMAGGWEEISALQYVGAFPSFHDHCSSFSPSARTPWGNF